MLLRPRALLPYVGPVSILFVEPASYVWPILMIFGLLVGDWLVPDLGGLLTGQVPRRVRNVLLLSVMVGLVLFAPAPLLHWFLRFTVLLGLSLALSPDEPNRPWKLFVVSFLLLLLAAAHTEDPTIALPILAFAALAPAALADLELATWGKPNAPIGRSEGLSGIALAALALIIFFSIPRSSRTFLGRGFLQDPNLGSFGDRITLDTITSIKLSPRIAMRVKVDGPLPPNTKWRGAAFDRYDGRSWSIGAPEIKLQRPKNSGIAKLVDLPNDVPLMRQEYQLEPGLAPVLFAARRAVRLESEFGYPNSLSRRGEDLALAYVPLSSQHYFVYSAVSAASRLQIKPDSKEDLHRYLDLPDIPESYRSLALEVTAGGATDLEKLQALERFFRTKFRYSLEVTRDSRLPPLDDFLFKNRVGHCEFFASGMVILGRTLGIPTRLVDGFVTGEYSDVTRAYIVRRSDAHAWVEAYVGGDGWTEFDPTPPAPDEGGIASWLGKLRKGVVGLWTRYVADYTSIEQQSALRIVLAILRTTLRLMPYVVIVAATLAWLPWMVRRAGRRPPRLRASNAALAKIVLRAFRSLRVLGISHPMGETVREIAHRAAGVAKLPSLGALVSLHEQASYAGTAGPDGAARAKQLLRSLRREIRAARARRSP